MARNSAAWVVAIVAVVAALTGTLVLTVVDPVMQALFDSALYSPTTQTGQDALQWQRWVWQFWPGLILVGLMLMVWVETRQPT